MNDNIRKSFFWNTIGSGLSSGNSLLFLVVVTRINGLINAGIFTLSYATACMFYVIATYSGRTYQVTETDSELNDNDFVFHRILSSIIMIMISILFGIINKYTGTKMIIFMLLCILKSIEAICDVFHGIIQKNNHLDIVGKSLFLRSLFNILIFIIIDKLSNNLILSTISLIVIDVIVLLLIDVRYSLKYKEKFNKINYQAIYKIFLLGFFTFGFSFIANYLVNAPRYAMDAIMSEEYQTIFGIVVMPATIIMLINQFIIQPLITTLKDIYSNKDKKGFISLIFKIIMVTFITGIISIILAYFFGIPVLNLLYGIILNDYLYSLLSILLGATLYTIATVLSNSLIVLRKTKIQLALYVVTSIFAFIISYKLINLFGFNGAIYSYVLTMSMLLILYIIYFIIVINKKNVWED